jgi:hypothetical protein
MLEPDTLTEIASWVRSGFYDPAELVEMFTEELYAPGELDSEAVQKEILRQFSLYEEEKLTYADTTDCDRLDTAFAEMNERGVIALQNAGYTQSDGFEDVGQLYQEHPHQASVLGYCFYHGQDLERALAGKGLYFAFGPVDPADEQTIGLEVGKIVRESLENAGLSVDWDGTFETRLSVSQLKWQKR